MNGKRDCKNCIHKVPVFDEEEGIWRGAECDSWECNFVSRAEALKAYEGRPQGEWEYNQYDGNPNIGNWHCSECRKIVSGKYNQYPNYNFCPNCGAYMKGGAE